MKHIANMLITGYLFYGSIQLQKGVNSTSQKHLFLMTMFPQQGLFQVLLWSLGVCECTCVHVQYHQTIAYSVHQIQTEAILRQSTGIPGGEFSFHCKTLSLLFLWQKFLYHRIFNNSICWKLFSSQLLSQTHDCYTHCCLMLLEYLPGQRVMDDAWGQTCLGLKQNGKPQLHLPEIIMRRLGRTKVSKSQMLSVRTY